ncbi:MAG: carboxypeptidase regulatory-like domain-containing protein [Planctomycetes bacterium]|nr:carboxypeptidase regulatory-like domain-containing protein [Planctomycetota bacterium]
MGSWIRSLFASVGAGRKSRARRVPDGSFRPALEVLEDRLQPSVTLGAAAPFAVLGINGGDVTLNSSSISGAAANIGLGPNETSTLQKTTVTGNLVVDPTASADLSRLGNNFDITGSVVYQDLSQAQADANAASSAFAAMTPTQALGNVTGSITVAGNGSVNVVTVSSLSYNAKTLTLNGTANDEFVFNVAGGFSFYQSKILLVGGVTSNHVIFNFPTAGSMVDFSKDSNVVNGTVLAPWRSVNYHNPAVFNGAIIAQSINIHSSGQLTFVPFSPPVSASPATISGYAMDTNGAALAGVTITLRDQFGNTVQQVTTDANGYYLITNIPADSGYSLSASLTGYRSVSATAGTDNGNPDGTSGASTITDIGLGSGDAAVNYNFVLTPRGT